MKKISSILVLFSTVLLAYGNISSIDTKPLNNSSRLVAWYPFNGNANDESGNGSNPTYIGSGVTLTSDRFGNPDNAYYFDGEAGSYIRMPADKFPTTDRTISFWFNADQVENHPTPLSYGGDVCHNSVLMIINKGDYPNAYTVLSHCATNFISAPYSEAPVNKWYHLTMTISGATQKIFINGELQQTANTFSTPTVVAGKSAILGAILFTDGINVYNEPTAGNFKGKMDDFRFYNVAFTDTEVLNHYNNEASGIVAYYPFNGNANDESGNGHDGSVSGATSTTDRFNQPDKAYNFVYNGFSSDKIQVSGTSELNFSSGGFSLSAWVKFSGLATGGYNYPIFSKHICGEQSGYILMLYNSKLTFWLAGSGAYNVVGTPDDYTDNSWHQVVAVYDGATQYIYVDGVLKNSIPFIYNTFNSANWALGGYNGCNGGFNGKVDEIKVFNLALTGKEIQSMYDKSANDLVAYYPFNGNAEDASGNMNDGIVNNAILTTDRYGNPNAAYAFDGKDSFIEGTTPGYNLPQGNSPRTFVGWIKENSFHPWGNNIFHYGLDQAAPTNFHFYTTDVIRIGNGYDFGVVAGTTPVVDSTWHFVAGIYEGGTEHIAKVYIDGNLNNSGNLSSEPNTILGSNWKIGRFMTGANNFDGKIDDLRIYASALTDQEIKDTYLAETTAPQLLKPENLSTVSVLTPLIEWSGTIPDAEYTFQLSAEAGFSQILHQTKTSQLHVQLPEGLVEENVNYFWRVRTTLNGETGPWSDTRCFLFVKTGIADLQPNPARLIITPNPADYSGRITYCVPSSKAGMVMVSVEVINSTGRSVRKLVNQQQYPGAYNLELNTKMLPAGVYFVKLLTENGVTTSKMVIVH